MKGSIIIVSFFVAGVLLGRLVDVPALLTAEEPTLYALYVLMFLVGISIGSDKKALEALKHQNFKIILVPLATIIGTLAGSALISLVLGDKSLTDCLAVGSGFGYYSLSTIFITQYKGAELGTIALVSNILRELIALLAAPLLVRYFGKLAPISVGGATTADTTLPIITRFCGKEFVIISIVHGITVDFPLVIRLLSYIFHLRPHRNDGVLPHIDRYLIQGNHLFQPLPAFHNPVIVKIRPLALGKVDSNGIVLI